MIKVEDSHFCPALSKSIKNLMTLGDKVILTIKPQYGFGDKGNPAHGIPPNATLKITLELLSWNQVPFLKMVLKEGEGDEYPNETALLRCKSSFIHSLF